MNTVMDFGALLPNLDTVLDGNLAIGDVFWCSLVGIFLLSCIFVLIHYINFRFRLSAIQSLIKGGTKAGLASERRDVNARAAALRDRTAGALWREFDESLVLSSDQQALYNTLDAEHFFNGRTLARGLTASRLLAAAPSFLVAIGVLGTFVGLSLGLTGLNVASDDVNELREGINRMIGGASVAFLTSVWGVLLSLLLNFGEKVAERSALHRIHRLQQEIDFLYPRIPAEQSLVHIADSTKESSDALKHLHEKIADRLQSTIQSMSSEMQEAIATSITNVLGPAIDALSNSATKQSSDLMEKLMGTFVDAVGDRGKEAAKDLNAAGDKVGHALDDLSKTIGQLVQKVSAQQEESLKKTAELSAFIARQSKEQSAAADKRENALTETMSGLLHNLSSRFTQLNEEARRSDLERGAETKNAIDNAIRGMTERDKELCKSIGEAATDMARSAAAVNEAAEKLMQEQSGLVQQLNILTGSVSSSTQEMGSASTALSSVTTALRATAESLGARVQEIAREIRGAAEQNQTMASAAEHQLRAIEKLQETLAIAARDTEQAAKLANSGYATLGAQQKEFLAGMKNELQALGAALRTEVVGIEEQASQWLKEYSTMVHTQVEDRMAQWNKTTLDYATEMARAVNSISSVVDELESRK